MIAALREKAKELGLAAVGIAPAIEEVRLAFDWSRSVVCAAISYLPPHFDSRSSPNCCRPRDTVGGTDLLSASGARNDAPRGLVARVARGADYHTVLREKLTALAQVIRTEHPFARAEVCVDTSPVPERKLAVLAGIAWRGKNGCVYVEGCGSWVALGEIVTDLPIEGDVEPSQMDRCGDCTRCIDACPTKAITAPCEIDCGRCLSALTQASGAIRPDLRPAMGNRIYGCDVCQEVCPQNAGILPIMAEFANEQFPGAHPEILPLISLTPPEFNAAVKNSSIGWIRRTRIRRNAAIAAGNLGCEEAIPALTEMLSDENPMLRETAEWALAMICGEVQNPRK